MSLTGYTTYAEEKVLPAIIPVCVEGEILWAYLDTGSGRNFISREAVKKLKLKPARHESRKILTVNGSKVQSMPIFDTSIISLEGKAYEEIKLTGSRLADFTTVRMPDMNQLKLKYSHTRQEVLHDIWRRVSDTSYPWRQYVQQNQDRESVQRKPWRAHSRRDHLWLGCSRLR